MSSLQRQLLVPLENTNGQTKNKKCDDNSINRNHPAFETCFSTGLDLSEFRGRVADDTGDDVVPSPSLSRELAQQKQNDNARRNREEKAEADLDQRVFDVVRAVKQSLNSTSPPGSGGGGNDGDDCSAVRGEEVHVPQALHPNNSKVDGLIMGHDRDENFVQFRDDVSMNGGFISSLVAGHKKGEYLETISHHSRKLMNRRNTSSRSSSVCKTDGGVSSRQQATKGLKSKYVAKKSKVTKYERR